MALASKGKFCYFNVDNIKEYMVGYNDIDTKPFNEFDFDKFKDDMHSVLISMGFIFFEDTLEHRVVLRRNGYLKEFALQYHHIK